MKKIRVLIADDHQIVRDGLNALINAESDMEVICGVNDGEAAFHQVAALLPDIVVMDISMPGLSGVKVTERITREHPEVKVVALTAHEEHGYISQMLRAGASGYVLKLAAAEELIRAIRVVSAGEMYLQPIIVSNVIKHHVRRTSAILQTRYGRLTERESEVFHLVVHGYVNKEIAAKLNISVKTVESHKSNAMEKLGLRSRADAVRYALGQGWLQH